MPVVIPNRDTQRRCQACDLLLEGLLRRTVAHLRCTEEGKLGYSELCPSYEWHRYIIIVSIVSVALGPLSDLATFSGFLINFSTYCRTPCTSVRQTHTRTHKRSVYREVPVELCYRECYLGRFE
jgi:hypothetical protein